MTYNIRLGMQRGVDRISEVIGAEAPDLVAIQEVGRFWTMGPPRDTTRELSELTELTHYDFTTTIRREREDGRDAEYGHAMLSRWPLERVARYNFSRDVDEPRAATAYRIECPEQPIMVLSTHLSHLAPERAHHGPELLELVERYSNEPLPLFVVGDLNECEFDCNWLHQLLSRMRDAAPDTAEPEPTFPAEEPEVRIDYLLADRGVWRDYSVVEEALASDHRPVVAEWLAQR